ncbi:coiled-coil protein required for normal flagellar motility [Haematococcus lacustris]|uniref:Coiled-coil protein required for normal flagellar motility n=1 Tax=Haematococcus lacustris TaxID=44745 RepID=A0A699YHE2_HAELA|nr:coiled-coil protein required for normal flagellar motility [Haematococcus lacustris]
MEAANAKLQELEAAFRAVRAKEQELQNEHAKLLNGLDRARVQVQTKDRHADDIRKDLELASIEADKILADQVDLDMRIKAAAAQAKMESEVLTRKVRRDLDISMNDFLKEEAVGKDKASVFQVTLKQVGLMEEELLALRKEEAERTKILMELGSQRDRVALAIAQKLAKVKEVQLTTRIKEVELAELKKIRRETNRRIRDFEKLYDLVKNQRNKFVNLIQASVTARPV